MADSSTFLLLSEDHMCPNYKAQLYRCTARHVMLSFLLLDILDPGFYLFFQ